MLLMAVLLSFDSQDSLEAMQSVFNAHIHLPQTRQLLVPHEVIDYVDQGRNPDIYTKELLDRVSGENMYTNGIVEGVAVRLHTFDDSETCFANSLAPLIPGFPPARTELPTHTRF